MSYITKKILAHGLGGGITFLGGIKLNSGAYVLWDDTRVWSMTNANSAATLRFTTSGGKHLSDVGAAGSATTTDFSETVLIAYSDDNKFLEVQFDSAGVFDHATAIAKFFSDGYAPLKMGVSNSGTSFLFVPIVPDGSAFHAEEIDGYTGLTNSGTASEWSAIEAFTQVAEFMGQPVPFNPWPQQTGLNTSTQIPFFVTNVGFFRRKIGLSTPTFTFGDFLAAQDAIQCGAQIGTKSIAFCTAPGFSGNWFVIDNDSGSAARTDTGKAIANFTIVAAHYDTVNSLWMFMVNNATSGFGEIWYASPGTMGTWTKATNASGNPVLPSTTLTQESQKSFFVSDSAAVYAVFISGPGQYEIWKSTNGTSSWTKKADQSTTSTGNPVVVGIYTAAGASTATIVELNQGDGTFHYSTNGLSTAYSGPTTAKMTADQAAAVERIAETNGKLIAWGSQGSTVAQVVMTIAAANLTNGTTYTNTNWAPIENVYLNGLHTKDNGDLFMWVNEEDGKWHYWESLSGGDWTETVPQIQYSLKNVHVTAFDSHDWGQVAIVKYSTDGFISADAGGVWLAPSSAFFDIQVTRHYAAMLTPVKCAIGKGGRGLVVLADGGGSFAWKKLMSNVDFVAASEHFISLNGTGITCTGLFADGDTFISTGSAGEIAVSDDGDKWPVTAVDATVNKYNPGTVSN